MEIKVFKDVTVCHWVLEWSGHPQRNRRCQSSEKPLWGPEMLQCQQWVKTISETSSVIKWTPPKCSVSTSRLPHKKCLSRDFPSFSVHSQQLQSWQNLFSDFHGACWNDGSLFVPVHCVVIIPYSSLEEHAAYISRCLHSTRRVESL